MYTGICLLLIFFFLTMTGIALQFQVEYKRRERRHIDRSMLPVYMSLGLLETYSIRSDNHPSEAGVLELWALIRSSYVS